MQGFEYKTVHSHNDDLFLETGWAFKHIKDLGSKGWEVLYMTPRHDVATYVFLKRRMTKSNHP